MSALGPSVSPFAGPEFAQSWNGWHGRECIELNKGGVQATYVRRPFGPLYTHDALPFGIPIFVSDQEPGHSAWIRAFFGLGRSIRSSLSLYHAPSHTYPGVKWHRTERSVISLDAHWSSKVNSKARSKARQAQRSGWAVAQLNQSEIEGVAESIAETDRRHGQDTRFSEAFFRRMLQSVTRRDKLQLLAATKNGQVGAFWLILSADGYETGWFNAATDDGRKEGAITLLTCSWLEQAAARGAACIDLGASPSAGVRKFKSTFGAQLEPLYSGTRRWHLFGT